MLQGLIDGYSLHASLNMLSDFETKRVRLGKKTIPYLTLCSLYYRFGGSASASATTATSFDPQQIFSDIMAKDELADAANAYENSASNA